MDAQRKQEIIAGLKNAATKQCDTGKEMAVKSVQVQASEHDVEAMRNTRDSLQKEVGKLHANEMEVAVYPEYLICDNEGEAQDLGECNKVKVELCR